MLVYSLAVTRALGDAYLKRADLSAPPFAAGAPYITCQPEVQKHALQPDVDVALIVASDGVWEVSTMETAVAAAMNTASHLVVPAASTRARRPTSSGVSAASSADLLRKSQSALQSAESRPGEFTATPAGRVVARALIEAASAAGMTVAHLRLASRKRTLHDDITAVVLALTTHTGATMVSTGKPPAVPVPDRSAGFISAATGRPLAVPKRPGGGATAPVSAAPPAAAVACPRD